MNKPVMKTTIPGLPVRRGKVRDVYDLDDKLLLVATDRISAFDHVMTSGIPDKGRILTGLSEFWFGILKEPNHYLTTDFERILGFIPAETQQEMDLEDFRGRSMLVRKTKPALVECVVRGYLEGSGWKEYQQKGSVCGIELPPDLRQCDELPEPLFTPATKAPDGEHDLNITYEQMCEIVGSTAAFVLRHRSVNAYMLGAKHAADRGMILADTKYEWGEDYAGQFILIDEVLTPDSSRFWPVDGYEPGHAQPSFDKQFLREWLETTDWDKNSTPPDLPSDIVARTRDKYVEAYELLTGKKFA